MKKYYLKYLLPVCLLLCSYAVQAQMTVSFGYTGTQQTWVVPTGVTSISVTVNGAQGGDFANGGYGAFGGQVTADLAVTPGTTLNIFVGGTGQQGITQNPGTAAGGFNGGGTGYYYGGGGGGATDIRIGGTALIDRIVVAGGGGGRFPNGGDGGDLVGGQAFSETGGGGLGGTQTAGGAGGGGAATAGQLGIGGDGYFIDGDIYNGGGGGGGGYYGGGGGNGSSGGGGGSSYTDPSIATNVIHTQGAIEGDGSLEITYISPNANAGAIQGLTYVCVGSTISLTNPTGNGGTWSSARPSKATINQSGVVTGISQGVDTILYKTGVSTARYLVTVYNNPVANAGNDVSICTGSSTTLMATAPGSTAPAYNWSPAGSGLSCTVCASPVATPTVTTTYVVKVTKNSCVSRDTVVVTVNQSPNAGNITGASAVATGATIALNTTGTNGMWSSSNTELATVNNAGMVAAIAAGVDTIKYTASNGCGTAVARKTIKITKIGVIAGPKYVCAGATITFADSAGTEGGVWSSVYPTATVDQAGVVTGVSAGLATIRYSLNGVTTQKSINVYALPNVNAGDDQYVASVQPAMLMATGATSYVWSPAAGLSCTKCANPTATIAPNTTTAYVVTGTKTGCSATDTVLVINYGNASKSATTGVNTISQATTEVKVYPNPTHNELNIELNANNEDTHITLVDITGRTVAEITNMKQANGNQHVTYNASGLAGGVYYVHIELGAQVMTQKVVIE